MTETQIKFFTLMIFWLIIVFLSLGMWWSTLFQGLVFAWFLWKLLGEYFPNNPNDKT